MNEIKKQKIEFGDFQTPNRLAIAVCKRLALLGILPDVVIEPTCGLGAFVLAAEEAFPDVKIFAGFEVNETYLDSLTTKVSRLERRDRIQLHQVDFFQHDWKKTIDDFDGSILVLGNFPWVTNSVQATIGGINLPAKTNFQGRKGFDAITGKANFDISEWMLLDVLGWFEGRSGDIAMLVKTSVARKILSAVEQKNIPLRDAVMIGIDAKREFGAAVEACLLVIRLAESAKHLTHDYTIFDDLHNTVGRRIGHRDGITVSNFAEFEKTKYLLGNSPQKWRSGIKHDASAVMEFTKTTRGLENGIGEIVDIEDDYLFPLLKGSDIGSNKDWRKKYMLVTQRSVGQPTAQIEYTAPKTWTYLMDHSGALDSRGSSIYAKKPRFSIFGVGDYAFRPWRIGICSLYKKLQFRLVGPIEAKPVMFDDTVYFISFEAEQEARDVLERLNKPGSLGVLSSVIFWDEKRPIKTSILNALDWSKVT